MAAVDSRTATALALMPDAEYLLGCRKMYGQRVTAILEGSFVVHALHVLWGQRAGVRLVVNPVSQGIVQYTCREAHSF